MPIRYSAATGGFYDTAVHAQIPDDAVSVTLRRHQELLNAQACGVAIVPGSTGGSVIKRPADNADVKREGLLRALKREAARRIERVSPIWRQLNDLREPDEAAQARFAAIDAIRSASDEIEALLLALSGAQLASFNVAGHPLWPAAADLPARSAEEEI